MNFSPDLRTLSATLAFACLLSAGGLVPKADPEPREPGVLILDGRIVDGPRQFEIRAGELTVDGRPLAAGDAVESAAEATSTHRARHAALREAHAVFARVCESHGADFARHAAAKSLEGHVEVESVAVRASSRALAIRFRGDAHSQLVELDDRPEPTPNHVEQLQRRKAALERWLDAGCLVICHRGALLVTRPAEGQATLQAIRRCCRALGSVESRTEALLQHVPDADMARAIATELDR